MTDRIPHRPPAHRWMRTRPDAVAGQKADARWYMRNIEVLWMRMGIRAVGQADT